VDFGIGPVGPLPHWNGTYKAHVTGHPTSQPCKKSPLWGQFDGTPTLVSLGSFWVSPSCPSTYP